MPNDLCHNTRTCGGEVLFIEIANRNPEWNLRKVFVLYSELEQDSEAVTAAVKQEAKPYFMYILSGCIQYSLRNYKMFFVEVRRLNKENNHKDCGLCGSFDCTKEHLADYSSYYINEEMLEIYQAVAESLENVNFSVIDEFRSGDN